jgi:hypothetical protein
VSPRTFKFFRAVGKDSDRFPMDLGRVHVAHPWPVHLVLLPITGSMSVGNPIYLKLRFILMISGGGEKVTVFFDLWKRLIADKANTGRTLCVPCTRSGRYARLAGPIFSRSLKEHIQQSQVAWCKFESYALMQLEDGLNQHYLARLSVHSSRYT